MNPIQLFSLASRQAEWLSIRQEVVASNIANVNTPEFRAKDITPFAAVLDDTQSTAMARTQPGHIQGFSGSDDIEVREAALDQEIGVQESGNTVSLTDELTKGGEIQRQYQLNANLVSSFHRMMLQTVKR
ncbi:flagellar basal body rod protein FlgB [Rhizobium halophytocola]|uniref:Flagellar basal body rod protein FlgB n=1 Tax=Rhizobium halophytocola TaxID=735519 RepID=A0ABS4E589_9HYPH|nr:flagellar basal body rod protein FlgB [Rhizobium halophytocola]MBP1853115.1 flagellar basal-body rod protein FlgB [Rhizobium halophytocola]